MTFRKRTTRLLLASLCRYLLISASTFAISENAPTDAPGQSTQAEQQQPIASRQPIGKEVILITREMTYFEFIDEVDRWEANAKKLIEQGKDPNANQVSYPVKPIYRKQFHWIGEDDFNTLYNIVLDAARHIDAINHEFDLAIEPLTEDCRNRVQAAEEKFTALAQADGEKRRAVVIEAMARLEFELTEEGFKKADEYIYDRYEAELRIGVLQRLKAKGTVNPATSSSQGVQP